MFSLNVSCHGFVSIAVFIITAAIIHATRLTWLLNRVPALIGWGRGGNATSVCELLYSVYV